MRLEHHLVGGYMYVRYISPYIIIIIIIRDQTPGIYI